VKTGTGGGIGVEFDLEVLCIQLVSRGVTIMTTVLINARSVCILTTFDMISIQTDNAC
jgi:hypothetical protein